MNPPGKSMFTARRSDQGIRLWPAVVAAMSVAVLGGCGLGGQQGPGPFEEPVPRERVRVRRAALAGAGPAEVIRLVKESPRNEDARTQDEWLRQEMQANSVHVLFPRWDAIRTSPHKYEVRFVYTEIAEDDRIARKGYVWPVDAVLGLVGEPRPLRSDELAEVEDSPADSDASAGRFSLE